MGFLKLQMIFGTTVALGIAAMQGAGSSTHFCRWYHLEADNLCTWAAQLYILALLAKGPKS